MKSKKKLGSIDQSHIIFT